jgi:hypothetical protein
MQVDPKSEIMVHSESMVEQKSKEEKEEQQQQTEEILPGLDPEDLVEGYSECCSETNDLKENPSETLEELHEEEEEEVAVVTEQETKKIVEKEVIDLTDIPDQYVVEHSDTDQESMVEITHPFEERNGKRPREESDSGSSQKKQRCLVNPSTYYNFSRAQRRVLKGIYPEETFKQIGDRIFSIWKALSSKEREQFTTKTIRNKLTRSIGTDGAFESTTKSGRRRLTDGAFLMESNDERRRLITKVTSQQESVEVNS